MTDPARVPALMNGPRHCRIIDLLQKSFMKVSDGGQQAEPKAKAFSSVSVSAAQNAEAFEVA